MRSLDDLGSAIQATDGTWVAWNSIESINFNSQTPEDTFNKLSNSDKNIVVRTAGNYEYRVSILALMRVDHQVIHSMDSIDIKIFSDNLLFHWKSYLKERGRK
jgi:hypothetical protein